MTQPFKQLVKIILGSLTLSSCAGHKPITVPDFEFCGWEGAAGGPGAACACAHTLFTSIPVAHYDLNTCLQKLRGAVFTPGASFNTLQANLDTLCAEETGVCQYEEVQKLQTVMTQIQKIVPSGKGVPSGR